MSTYSRSKVGEARNKTEVTFKLSTKRWEEIKEEIEEKVKVKEETNKYIERCLDVNICPQCGGNSKVEETGRGLEYTCDSCDCIFYKQHTPAGY